MPNEKEKGRKEREKTHPREGRLNFSNPPRALNKMEHFCWELCYHQKPLPARVTTLWKPWPAIQTIETLQYTWVTWTVWVSLFSSGFVTPCQCLYENSLLEGESNFVLVFIWDNFNAEELTYEREQKLARSLGDRCVLDRVLFRVYIAFY